MIKIDPEFQTLIPPLSDDEYQRLEKSILAEGVRECIITWDGTIIDGHNRYRICQKHGLECPSIERSFQSRDAAKIWIIENQLGRRNLEPGQKAALVIERSEAEVRERARLRQMSNLRRGPRVTTEPSQNENAQETGRTHEVLAKQAGVSPTTVKRVIGVKRKDPELYNKVRSGEITAREAYRKVTNEKKPKSDASAQRMYRDAGRDLRENVAIYTIESFLAELTASANNLRQAWDVSIEINESMGVKLTVTDKKQIGNAIENLFGTIERIRGKHENV